MKLSIEVKELTEEKGIWLAKVDWNKYDAGKVGTPGAVKYGDSEKEAYNKLKVFLENRGHEIYE